MDSPPQVTVDDLMLIIGRLYVQTLVLQKRLADTTAELQQKVAQKTEPPTG